MWYVFGEDLAPGIVGPFVTEDAAKEHLEFQRERGDASCSNGTACVVSADNLSSVKNAEWSVKHNLSTSEEDRSL